MHRPVPLDANDAFLTFLVITGIVAIALPILFALIALPLTIRDLKRWRQIRLGWEAFCRRAPLRLDFTARRSSWSLTGTVGSCRLIADAHGISSVRSLLPSRRRIPLTESTSFRFDETSVTGSLDLTALLQVLLKEASNAEAAQLSARRGEIRALYRVLLAGTELDRIVDSLVVVAELANLPRDEGIQRLADVAESNRSPAVRRVAIELLATQARENPAFERVLARAQFDGSVDVRAIAALERQEAIKDLEQFLTGVSPDIEARLLEKMATSPPRDFPSLLLERFNSGGPIARTTAARLLARFGPSDAIGPLRRALEELEPASGVAAEIRNAIDHIQARSSAGQGSLSVSEGMSGALSNPEVTGSLSLSAERKKTQP